MGGLAPRFVTQHDSEKLAVPMFVPLQLVERFGADFTQKRLETSFDISNAKQCCAVCY